MAKLKRELPIDYDTADITTPEPAPLDPYDGHCDTYTVTKEVNLAQLIDELSEVADEKVSVATFQPSVDDPISEENPLTLFIVPQGIAKQLVERVIDGHEADFLSHLTDAQRRQEEIKDKIRAGEPLTQEETTIALQALLRTGQ